PFDPDRRPARRQAAEPEHDPDMAGALQRAEARIAMLERTLMNTLRENARNWARAERAEALLGALERQGVDVEGASRPLFVGLPAPVLPEPDPDPRSSA
ncbi:MAG: hypothetical protein AAF675_03570, partial [Pseudomonadota bacterium]